MKVEDRQKLFDKLLGPMNVAVPERMRQELAELVTKDLDDIEPIIDQMLENAALELKWDGKRGSWTVSPALRVILAAEAFADAGTKIGFGSLDQMPSAIIHEVYDAVRDWKKGAHSAISEYQTST